MKCHNCESKKGIPGDRHILCGNPPSTHLEIGAGGKERYEIAGKTARENNAVVRCIWPGSGFFPFLFDGNTVFGCDNHKPSP